MNCCVACGSGDIHLCLDLGLQPLANSYKTAPDDPENIYPLGVNLCHTCYHLQLVHFVNPDEMFKSYIWVSGTSDHYRQYLEWFAGYVQKCVPDAKNVLDIGCNDGSQLNAFKALGFETFGVDPAENLAALSSVNHDIHIGYFGENYKPAVKFDVVTAANVFGHSPDPLAFLETCKKITHDDSKIFIQTSQANMVINNEFDTIYHEHISFFNCNSMRALVKRAGLHLNNIFKTNIHGTTYVFVISHKASIEEPTLFDTERALGLYSIPKYTEWAANCVAKADRLQKALSGKRVIAYGAAAKGNTVLNFLKVRPEVIVDDNPMKIGKFTPGMNAPVVASSYIATIPVDQPVVFLILAWNLIDEIKSKIIKNRNNPLDEFISI